MQDKELDQLFSDKLSQLSVEPSRGAWRSIANGLDVPMRQTNLRVYLSIAAAVLVMLTIGVYLIADKPVKMQQVAGTQPIKRKPAQEAPAAQPEAKQPVLAGVTMPENGVIAKARPVAARKHMMHNQLTLPQSKPMIAEQQPDTAGIETTRLAQVTLPKTPAIKFTVPDKSTPLLDKTSLTAPTAENLAAGKSAENKTVAAASVRKHKIRGIGDLLNAVVSKIDKRKDKLIEFSSKDEDEPSVTGLNLGFIKIKKQDR
ncbi:MAG: hypothetical protein C0191_00340 [Mucilaginibacter sp.]|nr:hypothetical protein [Mucilaginibacter sp. 44-25]PMP66466.1 MAG: hypothetical protein C0191_00340 [Mucilaginibacter sp.]